MQASCSSRCTAATGFVPVARRTTAAAAAGARRLRTTTTIAAAFTLEPASGGPLLSFDKPRITVGSAAAADLRLSASAVESEHAALTTKGRQVFLTALVGDSIFDSTSTWIDGVEVRSNVAYVLASGSTLAFGKDPATESGAAAFVVRFEEPSGSNPLVEMLMQGAAAGASPEVKKALGGAK